MQKKKLWSLFCKRSSYSSFKCKEYLGHVGKRVSSGVFLWLNSLGKGEEEPERSLSTHLNPTCDSPAQVSYSGGSKMSLRGVFTDLVTPTLRPLGRQIHRYRIAFLVASVAMARVEVTGLHFFLLSHIVHGWIESEHEFAWFQPLSPVRTKGQMYEGWDWRLLWSKLVSQKITTLIVFSGY